MRVFKDESSLVAIPIPVRIMATVRTPCFRFLLSSSYDSFALLSDRTFQCAAELSLRCALCGKDVRNFGIGWFHFRRSAVRAHDDVDLVTIVHGVILIELIEAS